VDFERAEDFPFFLETMVTVCYRCGNYSRSDIGAVGLHVFSLQFRGRLISVFRGTPALVNSSSSILAALKSAFSWMHRAGVIGLRALTQVPT
jgi:hypothetical protein